MSAVPAEHVTHPLTRTLLALTFSAGIVDAVSFLALGTVFSAAMNGNVLLLGFGVAGKGDLPVIAPTVAIVAFLLGALAGGVMSRRGAHPRPEDDLPTTIAVETGLIAATATYALFVDVTPEEISATTVIAVLAFAMGLRTATAKAIGVPDLSTTLVTLGMVALASEAAKGEESGAAVRRRVAVILALFAGALAGALLLSADLALTLFVTAAVSAAAGIDYARSTRRRPAG